MSILVRRHVPEEALAEIATDDLARAQLSSSDRLHLDACDRCRGLIDGHRRASRALAAPWQFVTAGALSTERGVERVRVVVSGGRAAGSPGRPMSVAVVLAALLLSALVGSAVLVGASHPSVASPLAVIPAASPSPTASPTPRPTPPPTPIDTSSWRTFESLWYGLTVSRPADWTATPASIPWDLIVDQDGRLFQSVDLFSPRGGAKTFAAYGMAIPDGMTSDGFIEAYRAPNVKRGGIECFPPPSSWEQVPIDGHFAGLVQGCGYIEAIVVVDRRIYIFSGYSGLAGNRRMFDAFLSTIRLLPANAAAPSFPASPSPS